MNHHSRDLVINPCFLIWAALNTELGDLVGSSGAIIKEYLVSLGLHLEKRTQCRTKNHYQKMYFQVLMARPEYM